MENDDAYYPTSEDYNRFGIPEPTNQDWIEYPTWSLECFVMCRDVKKYRGQTT